MHGTYVVIYGIAMNTMLWSGPHLAQVCGGRDNNLNLMRMLAASAVLVSHAFPITLGSGAHEPLDILVGRSLGSVAVSIFFVISGFLITRSFDRTERLVNWGAARFLRLFPGLLVALLLTVFVLGPLTTSLPLADYFRHSETLSYLPRNLSLLFLQYPLPGVFDNAAYPEVINGSLWTLFYEVACYLGVLVAGLLGMFASPLRGKIFIVACFTLLAVTSVDPVQAHLHPKLQMLLKMSWPFSIGTAFYVFRNQLPLNPILAMLLCAVAAAARFTPAFDILFMLALSYSVFVLAYLPAGRIRAYNRVGDYSYGIYIYAFPVQQLAVHLFPQMTPLQNILMAFPLTLALAMLSWTFIEKPALDARHILTRARA